MCGLLEVSRSGFYKWRKSRDGGPSPSGRRRAELDAKVADFHQASDGVYGAPRILADLRAAGELDRVWTSDITYLRTGQGWLYLCAVRDGCSRRAIGWAIDEHLHTDLVESALSMAVKRRTAKRRGACEGGAGGLLEF